MWWLSAGGTSDGFITPRALRPSDAWPFNPGAPVLESFLAAPGPGLPLLSPGTGEFNVRFCQTVLAFTHLESFRS